MKLSDIGSYASTFGRSAIAGMKAGFRRPIMPINRIPSAMNGQSLNQRVYMAFQQSTSFITFGIPKAFIAIGRGIYRFGEFIVSMVKQLPAKFANFKNNVRKISSNFQNLKKQGGKIWWKVIKYLGKNVIKAGTKMVKSYGKITRKFGEQLVIKPKKRTPISRAVYNVKKEVAVAAVRATVPLAVYGFSELIESKK